MEKNPFIGQLNRKVKLYTLTDVRNAIGENKPVQALFSTAWAMYQDLKTNTSEAEFVEGKVLHRIEASFVVRYRDEINSEGTKMLLEFEGKMFRIEHVQQIGRRRHLKLFVKHYE